MSENPHDIEKIQDSIEKVLVTVGGHKEYHAKVLAGAIVGVLIEEGHIHDSSNEGDKVSG